MISYDMNSLTTNVAGAFVFKKPVFYEDFELICIFGYLYFIRKRIPNLWTQKANRSYTMICSFNLWNEQDIISSMKQ